MEWQKPYSFTVMHAPVLLGVYNASPAARGLMTGVMDGWMAHGKQDNRGLWSYPNEINWRSDAERVGDGGGASTPLQSAWAAWRFTGDAKYLQPILGRVARSGAGSLNEFNENLPAVLDRKDWRDALLNSARGGGDFARYGAWDASGNASWLESLHADAIADKSQHMYMYTEGHWWSDRVEQPSDLLQRERLGGIAVRRNQTYPGHSVSWRFAEAGAAEKVALLVPGATPQHFRVIAWNTSDHVQRAEMSTWNVTAGRWRVRRRGRHDRRNWHWNAARPPRWSSRPACRASMSSRWSRPARRLKHAPTSASAWTIYGATAARCASRCTAWAARPRRAALRRWKMPPDARWPARGYRRWPRRWISRRARPR